MKDYLKTSILLILIICLLNLLNTQKSPNDSFKNQTDTDPKNNTDNNTKNDTDNKEQSGSDVGPIPGPIPDPEDQETDNESKNETASNKTDYDVVNDHGVENDNIEINIYKSNIPRKNITSEYKGFIELKNDFYRNAFKPFNYKYLPENKDYNNVIYKLSNFWYVAAGFVGILFIAYFILRCFFGKFRGAKDDNIHPDDKFLPWILLGNFIIF